MENDGFPTLVRDYEIDCDYDRTEPARLTRSPFTSALAAAKAYVGLYFRDWHLSTCVPFGGREMDGPGQHMLYRAEVLNPSYSEAVVLWIKEY